jgi:hypothetical protein
MTFLALLFAHALCDYPLQGDFLAKAKNRLQPIVGVPWWQALIAHGTIHAGAVYLVTDSLLFALFEFGAHMLIDDAKSAGRINYSMDQFLHVACKAAYCSALAIGLH